MYLVYDVGGTFIKYAIMDRDAKVIEKDKVPTPAGHSHTVEEFVEVIGGIYDLLSGKYDIKGLAMSIPGQIDVENDIVYGGGALPYLDKCHVGDILSKRCGGLHIAMENDAKCAALAESWIGNAKGCKTAMVLVFGTGAGGGLIINGKVHHGQDMVAGEISYWLDSIEMDELPSIQPLESLKSREDFMDFPKGFWNSKASTMYLRRVISKYKGLTYDEVTGEKIYQWAAEGDGYINMMLESVYLNIAKQIYNLYIILAPEIILIGGGISAQPEFFDGVMRYVNQMTKISQLFRSLKVGLCKYGNDSNLIGALKTYLQVYEEK